MSAAAKAKQAEAPFAREVRQLKKAIPIATMAKICPHSVAAMATNQSGFAGARKMAKREIKNMERLSGNTSGKRGHCLFQRP